MLFTTQTEEKNEKEVRDIRCKMEHFREAIKALRTVEKMNTPDGWEG